MPGGSEYRRYLRRPVAVEFHLREATDTQGGELLFDGVDISEGGAFLRSDYLLEIGDTVEVAFRLPNSDKQLNVRARVAWVTRNHQLKGEAGMGLEFLELPASTRAIIAEFIKTQRLQLAAQTP